MILVTIIIFIAVLAVLVLVHELGHFVAAKILGVKVEEFGFGFPPRIWAYKKGETEYSINWIPLGGFVKMLGQSDFEVVDHETTSKNKRSFTAQKAWKRVIILVAGVSMNFILAGVIMSIGFGVGLPASIGSIIPDNARVKDPKIQIIEVASDSPASMADMRIADEMVTINGKSFTTVAEQSNYIKENAGKEIDVKIKRGDEVIDKKVTPRSVAPEGEGLMGVMLSHTALVSFPWYEAIWRGFQGAGIMIWDILKGWGTIISRLFAGESTGATIAGPVGIAVLTGQMADLGFIYLMQFTALLSLNLAIINILPFPALDGGHLLFLLIERMRKKATARYLKIQNIIQLVGFGIIFALLAFVTYKDIAKIWDKIIGIFK